MESAGGGEDNDDMALSLAGMPPDVEHSPGEIQVQVAPNSKTLEQDAQAHLDQNPSLLARAQRLGHDIIAMDKRILIGAGLIAAFGAVAIVLWPRPKEKGKE